MRLEALAPKVLHGTATIGKVVKILHLIAEEIKQRLLVPREAKLAQTSQNTIY